VWSRVGNVSVVFSASTTARPHEGGSAQRRGGDAPKTAEPPPSRESADASQLASGVRSREFVTNEGEFMRRLGPLVMVAHVALAMGCSSSSNSASSGTGGSVGATGGAAATGGHSATGGVANTGGTKAAATGGTSAAATGGASSTATGGTGAAGGTTNAPGGTATAVSPPARGKAKAGILRAVTSAEAFLPLGRGPVPPDFRERDSERFLPGLQPGPLLGSGVGRELLPKS
jgi:hypothetical protein